MSNVTSRKKKNCKLNGGAYFSNRMSETSNSSSPTCTSTTTAAAIVATIPKKAPKNRADIVR